MEDSLHRRQLEAITSAHSRFVAEADSQALFDGLARAVAELTVSSYAFVAELRRVRPMGDDPPVLRSRAVFSGGGARRSPHPEELTSLDGTPLGRVLAERAAQSLAEVTEDVRLPAGYRPRGALLLAPCFSGRRLVALVGAAERRGGYSPELIERLQPLFSTCATLLAGYKNIRRRQSAEDALRDSEGRFRAIVENVVEALITINERGVIEWVNRAACEMFGYAYEELVGLNVSSLMPSPYREEHHRYVANYLDSGQPRIIGIGREAVARRRDGSTFPVELSVGEGFTGGQRLFTGMMRDITERQEVSRLKSEFVSIVSHELRTPLSSIRGSLGLLEGGVVGELPDKADEMVRLARSNTDRLIRLINAILDLDKIESRRFELEPEEVDLRAVIEATIANLEGMAQEREVQLVSRCDAMAQPPIRGNDDRVTQVLTNLLSNAIKFTPEGGEVEVRCARRGGMLRTEVVDQGPGIAAELQPKVFERFYQVDSSDTRARGGTGLGLAIAKAIVEQHGGQIGLESAVGKGSTFFFELPLSKGFTPVTGTPRVVPRRSVLVVEDDPALCRVLTALLAEEGFTPLVAHTLGEAEEQIAEVLPDAVLVDVGLPDGSGLDFVARLKRRPGAERVPVVVVSGRDPAEGRDAPAGPHLVDWITKPFDPNQLSWSLRRAMRAAGGGVALVVDDDEDARQVVCTQLGALGMRCIEAGDGVEAVRLAREHRPDLLILDVAMPRKDGYEVVEALRDHRTGATPVLIHTVFELGDDELSRLQLGVTRYLEKVRTNEQALLQAVRELVQDVLE